MLRDYTKYISISGKTREKAFQMEQFISSQKPDHRHFLREFRYTQQFDCYLTKCIFSPKDPEVFFFDQSITAKKNRSKMTLKKVDTPFLHSAKAHKKIRPVLLTEPN